MLYTVEPMMKKLDFPEDGICALQKAFSRITGDSAAAARFEKILQPYSQSIDCDYSGMLKEMEALSDAVQIHRYEGSMLLLLAMCEKLQERYRERGYDDAFFCNTMADLRYKLIECRLVYGINGTFVAGWFPRFYKLDRFAFGRLQFEPAAVKEDVKINGVQLKAGDRALNIHIPRTGTRLNHEEVLASYRQAGAFYRDFFGGAPAVFLCSSWLLYPWNRTVLSDKSNLAAFMADFQIVREGDDPDYGEVWRLFDCRYEGDADRLPQDSSLRRAYADRIRRGEPVGWGRGYFIQ